MAEGRHHQQDGVPSSLLACGVVGDVLKLGFKVGVVADVVFVIAGVPDFAERLFASRERVAAFDELEAAGGALIDRGRDENMYVIRHDREAV